MTVDLCDGYPGERGGTAVTNDVQTGGWDELIPQLHDRRRVALRTHRTIAMAPAFKAETTTK